MTKYSKVKKFMKETEVDKKTATQYLRDANWDYDQAYVKYFTEHFDSQVIENISEAFKRVVEYITEMLPKVIEDMINAVHELVNNEEQRRKLIEDYLKEGHDEENQV